MIALKFALLTTVVTWVRAVLILWLLRPAFNCGFENIVEARLDNE